eukprot:m.237910 g.237910  ORF g.237910 m.237910 type:complete len:187 (+) comp16057_c1_seq1:213-773(+)
MNGFLRCNIGHDGLDVGEGFTDTDKQFRYAGEVRNLKPNGCGIMTYKNNIIIYGNFKDGIAMGDHVMQWPDGSSLFWTDKGYPFDNNNIRQRLIKTEAEKSAAKARTLAELPWSPKTNHFIIFHIFQDTIFLVLLCAERLRLRSGSEITGASMKCSVDTSLAPLPPEIWELVLSNVVNYYHKMLRV